MSTGRGKACLLEIALLWVMWLHCSLVAFGVKDYSIMMRLYNEVLTHISHTLLISMNVEKWKEIITWLFCYRTQVVGSTVWHISHNQQSKLQKLPPQGVKIHWSTSDIGQINVQDLSVSICSILSCQELNTKSLILKLWCSLVWCFVRVILTWWRVISVVILLAHRRKTVTFESLKWFMVSTSEIRSFRRKEIMHIECKTDFPRLMEP